MARSTQQEQAFVEGTKVEDEGAGRVRVTRRWRITGGRRQQPQGDLTDGYRCIASTADHAAAARHVRRLAEQDVDVAGIRIVGTDLAIVEQVRGEPGLWQEILRKATAGAVLGALVAFFLGLFDPVAPLSSALFGVVFGALLGLAVGALWGAGGYLLLHDGRLDSRRALVARRHDVLAPEGSEAARRARP